MRIAYFDRFHPEPEQVREWLEEEGHQCIHSEDAQEILGCLRQGGVDVALLNWDLGGIEHMRLLEKASRNGHDIPVIVASESASREEITHALSQYQCEFMTRPLQREELLARLDTLWQHLGLRDATPQHATALGPWRVDEEQRSIHLNGRSVELTDKDFQLAHFLFRNVGKVLTRRELLREIWGIDAPVATRTVDVHVSRVRRSLEIDGRHGYHIKTLYQRGYSLEPAE